MNDFLGVDVPILSCKELECQRKAQSRGMCTTHYSSWYRANGGGRKDPTYTKSCVRCYKQFTTTTKRTIYCSLTCAQYDRAGRSKSTALSIRQTEATPVVHVKTTNRLTCGSCRVCGSAFVSFHTDVTCSPECYKIKQREARHEARQRRRALERDAYVAPVYRKRVFESDGYRCHICNKMTKRTAVVPHPMAPTIDHLIPLSLGGTHEPVNCRTAHFMCNSTKGHRDSPDQLILFAM